MHLLASLASQRGSSVSAKAAVAGTGGQSGSCAHVLGSGQDTYTCAQPSPAHHWAQHLVRQEMRPGLLFPVCILRQALLEGPELTPPLPSSATPQQGSPATCQAPVTCPLCPQCETQKPPFSPHMLPVCPCVNLTIPGKRVRREHTSVLEHSCPARRLPVEGLPAMAVSGQRPCQVVRPWCSLCPLQDNSSIWPLAWRRDPRSWNNSVKA